MPDLPLFLRRFIGIRIKQLTGSTHSLDAFAKPEGDPGLLGPDAVAWRLHAHFVSMMVGGLSSLMLQALHPRALAAVWDHSNFRNNLKGRLGRTAYFVAVTTYGSKADALAAIERVNRIHAQIKGHMPDGSPYVANEPSLLRWVHLGEVTSFLNSYQWLAHHPLNVKEENAYIQEMAYIGQRLGVHALPTDATSSHDALKQFQHELRFDHRTQEILRVIENYPVDPWDMPFMKMVIHASFHILPDWALSMLGKPIAHECEKQVVRLALRMASLPVQAALDNDGVAASAKRRVYA
ncbi:MAG: oxygenase MpaB family protein [Limnohabitans sp.]